MSLNDTIERLRIQRSEVERQERTEPRQLEPDPPMILPDERPTIRDLATALYMINQAPTCRNCLRRERGDCPSKQPMPKSCVSFQLNSRQMQTYGQQARNVIKAWSKATEIHAARVMYYQSKNIEQ